MRSTLTDYAATVDAGYPDNSDLVTDEASGKPSLRRRRAKPGDPGVLALEQAIKERMPERTLLEILACTAYWVEWWRRFGPASGSDPKLADSLLRYVLTRSPTAATWVRRRPRARSAGCPRTSAARRRRGTSRRASSTARDRLHADRRRHDLQVSA